MLRLFKSLKARINLFKLMDSNLPRDELGFVLNRNRNVITTEDYDTFQTLMKENSTRKIISTHSGAFHTDEVLAVTMAKYLKEYEDALIIRSRNDKIHTETNLVLDVGGVYDPNTNRLDHHMKEFTYTFEDEMKIKMSSAGLMYKHFGMEILRNILQGMGLYDQNADNMERLYKKLYVNFFAYIDGNDNGVNQYPDDIIPRYTNSTSLTHRISRLNPEWNDKSMDQSLQFKKAMDVAEEEFISQVKFLAKSYFAAYNIVKNAVVTRKDFHPSGRVIYFETGCPWKEILFSLEEEMNLQGEILFVVSKLNDTDHRVVTIPLSLGNFKFRKGLPELWRGVAKNELAKMSQIEDIIFVHSTGFIGGAKSLPSAIKMVEESLKF